MKSAKKLLMVLGALLGLMVAAAIIIPLVVDVDKYRPQILQVANEKLNGKLDIGKLTLSLWGRVLVRVDGVKLVDAQGESVVSVSNAYFQIPFASVFGGSPRLIFKMEEPAISVSKSKLGKLNVMSLMKESPASEASSSPAAQTSGSQVGGSTTNQSTSSMALPGLVANARMGVELLRANIDYKDLSTGLTNKIQNLNVIVRDLSIKGTTEFEVFAKDIDTKMAKVFTVKGPFRLEGAITPRLNGTSFAGASGNVKLDLDGLDISVPGVFQKKSGIPAHLVAVLKADDQAMKIEKFDILFHNIEVNATGTVSNLGKSTDGKQVSPIVDFHIKSNEVDLKPWSELIPPMKDYDLSGKLILTANANGPSDQLNYDADILMKSWSAKAAQLKVKPEFNGEIKIKTDQLEKLLLTLQAPGTDLQVSGNVTSFKAPRAKFLIKSTSLDLDQLINFPPAKKSAALDRNKGLPGLIIPSAYAEEKTAPAGSGASADLDKSVDALRTSEMIRAMVGSLEIDMKKTRAYGIDLSNLQSNMTFQNLVFSIDKLGFNLFDGQIKADTKLDMKPAKPSYDFSASVVGFDLKKAVVSQLELFKNTVVGKADFQMKGHGSSFNSEPAKVNLDAKGSFKIKDAKFASIDVNKMVTEGLNKSFEKIGDKVPGMKGKSIKGLPEGQSRYEILSSTFSITRGKFTMPDFVAKSMPKEGVDLKGFTEVGLVDKTIKANWQVIDTHNMTQARDLSVDVAGQKVDHILAKGNDPVTVPIDVSGTLDAPKYSYAQIPEALVQVALSNMTGAAKDKVKKQVMEQLGGKAPGPAKKLLEGFGKKLFGR